MIKYSKALNLSPSQSLRKFFDLEPSNKILSCSKPHYGFLPTKTAGWRKRRNAGNARGKGEDSARSI